MCIRCKCWKDVLIRCWRGNRFVWLCEDCYEPGGRVKVPYG